MCALSFIGGSMRKSPRDGPRQPSVLSGATTAPSRLFSIQCRRLRQQPPPNVVGEAKNVVKRPVQVVGQEPDFLPEAVGPDRCYSPGPPPATSTVKEELHEGQVTSASVWPSVLILRYMSCRKARSVAHSPPMT